ncbi:hypothetical protein cand_036410 [Cryptosporidium andersoni]|uniref:Ribosome biogenesis protein BMS1/TSR1 C-terminal domain-containing protein n=1 Tax=Cryptosporidium andersoni TaxID=117008 RepID=A0A1J4MYV0_9CRYT|nr:hypothetical protein cand_036410 [Cryptosporidium andersoni]
MHHHRSTLKQKNKPFKHGKSHTIKKVAKKVTQYPMKILSRQNRNNQKIQIRRNKNLKQKNTLIEDGRGIEAPILCVIVPFHVSSNPLECMKIITNYISKQSFSNKASEYFFQTKETPSNFEICTLNYGRVDISFCIAPYGDMLNTLDIMKCADIILGSFCSASLDSSVIDEFGYRILSVSRLQGLCPVFGIYFDDNGTILEKRILNNEKLLKRYFEAEFGKNSKLFSLNNTNSIRTLISAICNHPIKKLSFRNDRGYLLSQNTSINFKDNDEKSNIELVVEGYIRGSGLSIDFPVHVTGFGDFVVASIEPTTEKDRQTRRTSKPSKVDVTMEYFPIIRNNLISENDVLKNELVYLQTYDQFAGEQSWDFQEDNEMVDNNQNEYTNSINEIYSDTNSMYSQSEVEDNSWNSDILGAERVQKLLSLEDELENELEHSDEIRVDNQTICRQRFAKYRGLSSFRTSYWDPYENLPSEYSRIFEFESFQSINKLSRKIFTEHCREVDYQTKYYRMKLIPIAINSCIPLNEENLAKRFIIVSSILPYERKVGVIHFKVKRTKENEGIIRNKTPLLVQAGFRRFFICPTFSNCPRMILSSRVHRQQKLKMSRFFIHGDYYIASCFSTITFPPCPVIFFSLKGLLNKKDADYSYPSNNVKLCLSDEIDDWPLAWGDIIDSDPCRIILKRYIIIGYLFKVRKCKAIVRFMFNNPEDIKWFKSVELKTRSGIRGIIKEPVGTHGYMKCIFSKPVQQNEVVGMSLYKRVYPKWFPQSWFGSDYICDSRSK